MSSLLPPVDAEVTHDDRGRSPWRTSAFVIIFLGLVYYAASPWTTVYFFWRAATAGDIESVASGVDLQNLRSSIKYELNSIIDENAKSMADDNSPWALFGEVVARGAVELFVDSLVTPRNIASLARGESLALEGSPVARTLVRELEINERVQDIVRYDQRYESLNRFAVNIKDTSCKFNVSILFHRHGLFTWKLSGMKALSLDPESNGCEMSDKRDVVPGNADSSSKGLSEQKVGSSHFQGNGKRSECFEYMPVETTIKGKLKRFPGLKPYWAIIPDRPICINAELPSYEGANPYLADLASLQIVLPSGMLLSSDAYDGITVLATGELFPRISHGETPALLQVKSLSDSAGNALLTQRGDEEKKVYSETSSVRSYSVTIVFNMAEKEVVVRAVDVIEEKPLSPGNYWASYSFNAPKDLAWLKCRDKYRLSNPASETNSDLININDGETVGIVLDANAINKVSFSCSM